MHDLTPDDLERMEREATKGPLECAPPRQVKNIHNPHFTTEIVALKSGGRTVIELAYEVQVSDHPWAEKNLIVALRNHAPALIAAWRLARAVDKCGRDHKRMMPTADHPCEERIYRALEQFRSAQKGGRE